MTVYQRNRARWLHGYSIPRALAFSFIPIGIGSADHDPYAALARTARYTSQVFWEIANRNITLPSARG